METVEKNSKLYFQWEPPDILWKTFLEKMALTPFSDYVKLRLGRCDLRDLEHR
jgi:hypothetical protein